MSYTRATRPVKTTRGRTSPGSNPYARARPSQHRSHSSGAMYQSGGRAMDGNGDSSFGYQGSERTLEQRESDMVQPETNSPGVHERSLQSRGTHYVLPPDPARNSQLKQTASAEEVKYEQYRQIRKEQTARELRAQSPKSVGGATRSQWELDALREKQEKEQRMEARFKEIKMKEKKEEYRRQKREREDHERQKKMEVQREKAVKLEQRKQEEQKQQQEEVRRKRLARFDPKTA